MSTTTEARREIERAVRRGLRPLEKAEPLRLSQWAEQHFYLSAESSYIEGRWEALPYQVGIMDMISNDDVRSVTVMKSARVGYTKMIVAAIGYFAEHKRRNQVVFQPVDQDAEDFTKDEIDPMLRDCVAVQRVFPHFGAKSKMNTLTKKVFAGSTLDIRGGKAAKNYRRLSKDVALYDELDGFDSDIEGEGDPVTLGDKRIEGATFPKSVRGSTPKKKGPVDQGGSLIEAAYDAADQRFTFHTPCPHCGGEQVLKWGGADTPFGFKWHEGDPASAAYMCEHCKALFTYEQHLEVYGRGRWISEDGIWLDPDGYFRAESGEIVDAPEHCAVHIWTGIAGLVPWPKLVREFLAARKDRSKLKTFVNTTLGETWEEDEGERADDEVLYQRRETYAAEVPAGVQIVVASIDTHDDRFEIQFDGYGWGEERWTLDYVRLFGDPSRGVIWDKLEEQLRRTFVREDGVVMQVAIATQDHGGHYSDEVNAFSKRMGVQFLIPVKGSNQAGRPIAHMPRKRNANGVYLTEVGTDSAKSLLFQRYQITVPGPGRIHWPSTAAFDRDYFKQLTAEERVRRYRGGQAVTVWVSHGRRNEATDCSVYSLAAVRIAQQNFGFRFVPPEAANDAEPAPSTRPAAAAAHPRAPLRRPRVISRAHL